MVRSFIIPLLVLLLGSNLSFAASSKASKSEVKPQAYIETVLSPEKTVDGISVIYSVVVYSTVPDILKIEIVDEPDFGPLKKSPLRIAGSSDSYLGEIKRKGTTWYGFVVDNIVVTPSKPGKYMIKGGVYNICLGVEGIVDDWFWGRQRTTVPSWIEEVVAPDVKLEAVKRDSQLSSVDGMSIGDFSVEWSVPPGDINQNSRAIAILKVTGRGTLDEESVPDFKSLLGENMKVVYVRPTVRTWMKGTDLMSEMDIVVEFIPSIEGDVSLPAVDFIYLDPTSGKIKKSTAPKIEIKVKADRQSPSSKAKIYDI